MRAADQQSHDPVATHADLGAIAVSLELSRSTWLVTSLSPGSGEGMSSHSVPGGDIAGLLRRFSQLQDKAERRTGRRALVTVIQEAGLDGFWIHRALQNEGIESHVVDAASIATSRRRRRAKTDRIDGEALVRALLAYKRGEPRVCAMVQVPAPDEEDRRRVSRERKTLTAERVGHVNRIKGLLFAQGIRGRARCPARRGKGGKRSDAGGDADGPQGHRCGVRHGALVGRVVPDIRQPATGCNLCRTGTDTLAERDGRPRTGCRQVREPAAAIDHAAARVAVAAVPARVRA